MSLNVFSTNYFNTFIEVAPDSPVDRAQVPPRKEHKSMAYIEYEMIIHNPYKFTSDDVIYKANIKNKKLTRAKFFSKAQPCLRSSPLTKRYGWGVHCNEVGKIAIFPVESVDYKTLAKDLTLKHIQGMRSKRI